MLNIIYLPHLTKSFQNALENTGQHCNPNFNADQSLALAATLFTENHNAYSCPTVLYSY